MELRQTILANFGVDINDATFRSGKQQIYWLLKHLVDRTLKAQTTIDDANKLAEKTQRMREKYERKYDELEEKLWDKYGKIEAKLRKSLDDELEAEKEIVKAKATEYKETLQLLVQEKDYKIKELELKINHLNEQISILEARNEERDQLVDKIHELEMEVTKLEAEKDAAEKIAESMWQVANAYKDGMDKVVDKLWAQVNYDPTNFTKPITLKS